MQSQVYMENRDLHGGDLRLEAPVHLTQFEVRPNEVTYIGDYHFNMYIKKIR